MPRVSRSSGRYSRNVSGQLKQDYERLLADETLLNLADEIAMLQTIYGNKLEEIQAGGAEHNWQKMASLWEDFMQAVVNGDSATQTRLVYEVDELITKHAQQTIGIKEVQSLSESLRRLVESESKRRVQNETLIGVENVMLIIEAALTAFKESAYKFAEPLTARKIIGDAEQRHRRLIGVTNGNDEIAGSVVPRDAI